MFGNTVRKSAGLALATAFVIAAPGQPARAATETSTLGITVDVVSACAIQGGTIDFGTYESGQIDTIPAVGTISYTGCPEGAANIALDGGQSGDEQSRAMTDGNGNQLNYRIFQDAARTTNWGTGVAAKTVAVEAGGVGSWEVYGRIIREQSVPAGTYADSINITITF